MEKIRLDFPITLSPHPTVTGMTMRRPKAADVLEANRRGTTDEEVEMHLFAILTGQAFEVIAETDYVDDYPKFQAAYRNFRAKPVKVASGSPTPTTSASNASTSPATGSPSAT